MLAGALLALLAGASSVSASSHPAPLRRHDPVKELHKSSHNRAKTLLLPVHPHHHLRARSANTDLGLPAHEVTLHYAEAGYAQGPHYSSQVTWSFHDPAIVINDHRDDIESIDCTEGIETSVKFTSAAAFATASKWPKHMLLITEEWHEISLGHVNSSAPHVVPAGHHSNSSLATRGVLSAIDDALFGAPSWTIGADVNYDSIGKQPVLDTIPFFAAINEKYPANRAILACENCYFTGAVTVYFETGSGVGNLAFKAVALLALGETIVASKVTKLVKTAGAFVVRNVRQLGQKAFNAAGSALHSAANKFNSWLHSSASDKKATFVAVGKSIAKDYHAAVGKISSAGKAIGSFLGKEASVAKADAVAVVGAVKDFGKSVGSAVKSIAAPFKKLFHWRAKRASVNRLDDLQDSDEDDADLDAQIAAADSFDPAEEAFLAIKDAIVDLNEHPDFVEHLERRTHPEHLRKRSMEIERRELEKRAKKGGFIGVKGGMKANADFHLTATGDVTVDYERHLAKKGIPELSIPKVATLGPEVQLLGLAEVGISATLDASIGADFTWDAIDAAVHLYGPGNSHAVFGKPKVHLHGPEFNLTSVAVKAEISLYPQIMFGIDLEAARTSINAGIGIKIGYEVGLAYGDDDCNSGVLFTTGFDVELNGLVTPPGATHYKSGDKDTKSTEYQIGSVKPFTVYSHCWDLSPLFCKHGEVFNDQKLQCYPDGSSPAPTSTSSSSSSSSTSTTPTSTPTPTPTCNTRTAQTGRSIARTTNYDLYYHDIAGSPHSNIEDEVACEAMCAADNTCVANTFYSHYCFLKSSVVPSDIHPNNLPGAVLDISGTCAGTAGLRAVGVPCADYTVPVAYDNTACGTASYARFAKTDMAGNSISCSAAADESTCLARCSASSSCVGATFVTDSGPTCCTKSSLDYGSTYPSTDLANASPDAAYTSFSIKGKTCADVSASVAGSPSCTDIQG